MRGVGVGVGCRLWLAGGWRRAAAAGGGLDSGWLGCPCRAPPLAHAPRGALGTGEGLWRQERGGRKPWGRLQERQALALSPITRRPRANAAGGGCKRLVDEGAAWDRSLCGGGLPTPPDAAPALWKLAKLSFSVESTRRRTPKRGSAASLLPLTADDQPADDWDSQAKEQRRGAARVSVRRGRRGASAMELFRSEEMQLCQVGGWGAGPRPAIAAIRAGGFGSAAAAGQPALLPLPCAGAGGSVSAPLLPCSSHGRALRPARPAADDPSGGGA